MFYFNSKNKESKPLLMFSSNHFGFSKPQNTERRYLIDECFMSQ